MVVGGSFAILKRMTMLLFIVHVDDLATISY
jgi:hypothetical protein